MLSNDVLIDHNELLEKQKREKDCLLIDVRSKDEHLSGAIKDSICIPHAEVLNNLDKLPKDQELIFFCRSGNRSNKVCTILGEKGYTKIKDLKGGMIAWSEAGMPIHKQRQAISITRQVMIGAGIFILTGASLGHFVNYNFWAISAFVGLGLFFAGLTGFCGFAILLEQMPWNKTQ